MVAAPRGVERPLETVEIDWTDLVNALPEARPRHIQVTRAGDGEPIASQTIDADGDGTPEYFIFQTDFLDVPAADGGRDEVRVRREDISILIPDFRDIPPHDSFPSQAFTILTTEQPARQSFSQVYGRQAPSGWNYFAWENDRVAFRLFGPGTSSDPAGASQLMAGGVDIWGKRPPSLIVNRWYRSGAAASHRHLSAGLAFYSVKDSRGCGGAGIWRNGVLHVSGSYETVRMLADGPIRLITELTYAPVDVGGFEVSEVKRITLDVGRNFNLTESVFTVHGSLGTAVIMDPEHFAGFANDRTNDLILAKVKSGETLRFMNGFGWTESGQFPEARVWEREVVDMANRWGSSAKVAVRPSLDVDEALDKARARRSR